MVFYKERPILNVEEEHIYQLFMYLSNQRTSSGFGMNPIAISEMEVIANVYGVERKSFIEMCVALDIVFREYNYTEQEKKQKPTTTKKTKTR